MRRHGRGAMALGIAYMSTSKGNGPGPPWGLPLFRQPALYCHVDIGGRQAVHVGTWGVHVDPRRHATWPARVSTWTCGCPRGHATWTRVCGASVRVFTWACHVDSHAGSHVDIHVDKPRRHATWHRGRNRVRCKSITSMGVRYQSRSVLTHE